jgi:hypothetical protein
MTEENTMDANQGLALYYMARARHEQITRDSLSPVAAARREAMKGIGRGRRQRRRWWAR